MLERPSDQPDRAGLPIGEDRHSDPLTQLLELFDGGRPLKVGGHQQHPFPVVLEHACQLAGGGGLSRPLEAGHEDDQRLGGRGGERDRLLAESLDQRLVDEFDDLLPWREALHHLGSDRPLPHAGEEVPGDADVHIGLEQRQPHLPQHLVDVGLAQPAPAAEAREDPVEAVGERLEHPPHSTERRFLGNRRPARRDRAGCR